MSTLLGISRLNGTVSATSFRIDAADDAAANMFIALESKAPKKVHVYVSAEAGTSPAYTVEIQTISSDLPSGSLYDANATGTFTATAAGWYTATFSTTPAALAKGTRYAVVVSSASAGATDYVEIRATGLTSYSTRQIAKTAGTWGAADNAGSPFLLIIEYDDGTTYWPHDMHHSLTAGPTGRTVSSTNRVGIKFTAPVTGTLQFARVYIRDNGASVDASIILRAVGGGSDLASVSLSRGAVGTTAFQGYDVIFATAPSVTEGSQYVLYLKSTGTQWTLYVSSMGANCPPMPENLVPMVHVEGNAEPPATEDEQYLPLAQFYFLASAGGGGGAGPLVGPGRLIR